MVTIEKILYDDIFPEMFKRVGATETDIKSFINTNDWYHVYEWTKTEEDDFIAWLSEYFKTNKKAFHLIGKSYVRNNKENRKKLAIICVSLWGWKIKKEQA